MASSPDHLQPRIPPPNWCSSLLVWFLLLVKSCRGVITIDGLRKRTLFFERKKIALPPSLTRDQESIAGLNCDRLLNPRSEHTVLHLYGGGGCVRMPNLELPAIAQFCERINAQAFLPWYRLAPEFKFPQGPEDCFSVYQALLEQGIDPKHLVLSGSSAGGGNVLSLLALIKRRGLPMPACAVMLSPSGDCLMVGDSWQENARRDPMFQVADVLYFQSLVFSPEQRADPLVNVSLMDEFVDYPPLYFTASSHEVLRDVSVMAHQKAQAANICSQLDIYSGSLHCMPLMLWANQAKSIWARIDQFVLAQLNSPSQ